MTNREIDQVVENLIKEAGSSRLDDIISSQNITLKAYTGKSFYIKNENKKYIFLDTKLEEEARDFALAHELGHAILHTAEISQSFVYRRISQQTENEANYFAYKLLGLEIDPAYNYTIDQYARQLRVSEDTIKYLYE